MLAYSAGTGYFRSHMDHDDRVIYFVKKSLTFRREFINPFANEGDPPAIDNMRPEIRKELIDYCHYAHGLVQADLRSLHRCRDQAIGDAN